MNQQPDLFATPAALLTPARAGLDVDQLAADYSRAIRAALGDQLASVIERDRAERDPLIEHAQDFIDTADILARAIRSQLGTAWSWADVADEAAEAARRARAAGYELRRVLVGCEFSNTVAASMRALGHDAVTADLLETEGDRPDKHHTGDVREIMGDGFDFAIYHPPCTYLAASQAFRCTPKHDPTGWRQQQQREALEFVRDLMTGPVKRWALENPKGCISTKLPADLWTAKQMIQPYNFGHDVSKQTMLYLRGLPELVSDPADYIPPRVIEYLGKQVNRWANQSPCGADSRGPSATRGKDRSRFFAGIAAAMAAQWAPINPTT